MSKYPPQGSTRIKFLTQLLDINILSPSNNQIPSFQTADSKWANKTTSIEEMWTVPNISLITAGLTRYVTPCDSSLHVGEEDAKTLISKAFTLKQLRANCLTNLILSNTVITVRKNGVNTASTVTYGSGETGDKNDIINQISFSVGDKISISIVSGSVITTMANLKISLLISSPLVIS